MTDPLIVSYAVAFGGGAWLADKLLGPSFDALGDRFQKIAERRLKSIFSELDGKANSEEIGELPAAFAVEYIEGASRSEDDDIINKMWASLLLGASLEFSSRHKLFLDILKQLGSDEARALDEICPNNFTIKESSLRGVKEKVRVLITKEFKEFKERDPDTNEVRNRILNLDFDWPLKITNVGTPTIGSSGKLEWFWSGQGIGLQEHVLLRLQLIEKFDFDLHLDVPSVTIEGIVLTEFGKEFLECCRSVN